MGDFCFAPWTNIHLHPSGEIKPCCVYLGSFGSIRNGESLQAAYSSAKATELRARFLRGEHTPHCAKCFQKEKAGAHSQRMEQRDRAQSAGVSFPASATAAETDVVSLDVSFSNICNMTCRFCGPGCSSKWITEAQKIPAGDDGFWSNYLGGSWKPYFVKAADLLETISYFPSLRFLEIKGGEAFLHPEHFLFLEGLIKMGRAHQITLSYVTNGTLLPERFIELGKEFESLDLTVSMDGVGDLYSYIRGLDDGERRVKSAIQFFARVPKARLSLHYTLCALNVFGVKPFYQWAVEELGEYKPQLSAGMVVQPRHLDVRVLPDEMRREAVDRLPEADDIFIHRIREILLQPAIENALPDFWRFVDGMDRLFGTKLEEVVPEFAGMRSTQTL